VSDLTERFVCCVLLPSTDCGLVPRSRQAALGKMQALAAGAALVRQEIGVSS